MSTYNYKICTTGLIYYQMRSDEHIDIHNITTKYVLIIDTVPIHISAIVVIL